MTKVGEIIRKLRERDNLLLRELASGIVIDQALLSKIERGERIATKKQIISLAIYFNIDQNELLSQWLGEKIAHEIRDEVFASNALKVAEEEITHYKKLSKELKHV
jgi:transcriptional regulator with XRE-family HTH domain